MTVASATAKSGPYNGNGSQTVFAYGFKVFANTELRVIRTSTAGVETTLTLTTDYTVSGVGADAGGNVTTTVAPATGEKLTILRNVPFTQTTDLRNQGGFFPEVHERVFDRTMMAVQQLSEEVARAVKVDASSSTDPDDLIDDVTTAAANASASASSAAASAATATAAVATVGVPTVATFTGNGVQTVFSPLGAVPPSTNAIMVFVGGVHQERTKFSFSGTTLTFVTAPPNLAPIQVVIGAPLNSTTFTNTVGVNELQDGALPATTQGRAKMADGFVTSAKLDPAGVSTASFDVTGLTAPANGVYRPAANTVGIASNSVLRAQAFDESGNTRFLIGSTTPGRASGIVAGTFMVVNPSGNAPVNLQAFGATGNAIIRLIANQGTETAPTATTTANAARIELSGYDGTANGAGATINFINGSTWSGSNRESYISFATVASGSTTPTERVRMAANGSVQFPGITTTASAANAFLDSGSSPANNLLRVVSGLRYKRNVEDADPALTSKIFDLRPVWYRSKAPADNPNWGWWGFIAEEVAQVDPRLVHWAYAPEDFEEFEAAPAVVEMVPTGLFDADGIAIQRSVVTSPARIEKRLKSGAQKVPDGVQYERMIVLMLAELKALRARVAALEGNQ